MIGPAGILRRFGLGPRPGDLATFADARAAVAAELNIPGIADLAAPILPATGEALAAYVAERQAERLAQAAATNPARAPATTPAPANNMLLDAPPAMTP